MSTKVRMQNLVAVVCLSVFSLQTLAAVPPGEHNPSEEPPTGERVILPVTDLYQYDLHIPTLPNENPSPVKIEQGDEVTQIAYVDAEGKLYDVQLNLTKAFVKILRNGVVVGTASLTQEQVDELRQASISAENAVAIVTAIVVGLLVAVVGFALNVAWDHQQQKAQCQRGLIAANRMLANEAASCSRQGGTYKVDVEPSMLDCGLAYAGHCDL